MKILVFYVDKQYFNMVILFLRLRVRRELIIRRDGRAVEGTGLENRRCESIRGFESHSPEMIRLWKDDLRARNYVPSTINTYLAALNGFFRFCGWADCRARFLKIQRRLFRDSRQELTRGEYERLVAAAEATGDRGLALLMETICSTGIRVSEVQYITVEAAKNGKTEIALKGKIRTILLPSKLCRKLLKFAARQKPPPARSFAPKAASPCRDIKFGRK